MRYLIFLFVLLITIFSWGETADASYYYWEKISEQPSAEIYASPDYEQDKTLFALNGNDFYLSTNEGITWAQVNENPVWQVQIADDGSVYTLQGDMGKKLSIYKFQSEEPRWVKICDAFLNTNMFAVLNSGIILISEPVENTSLWQIMRTENKGLSWHDTRFDNSMDRFVTAPDGLVLTIDSETQIGLKSTDSGVDWDEMERIGEFSRFFVSPHYLSDHKVFAVINKKSIYCTYDKGENWFGYTTGINNNSEIMSLAFSFDYEKDKTIYAADKDGHVFVSSDGVLKWRNLDVKLENGNELNNIAVLPDGTILASTEDGIYKISRSANPGEIPVTSFTVKFPIGQMSYELNNDLWYMDAAPYVENGRTYVPVRYLAKSLGVKDSGILWDEKTGTVTLSKDTVTVKLSTKNNLLLTTDKRIMMDVQPQIKQGRVMLPARWVAEAFGAEVSWSESEKTVIIRYETK